jgi:hypothetical protein
MDTAASTGGLPFFPNTNQALTGQPYDLLLLFKYTSLFLSYLAIFFWWIKTPISYNKVKEKYYDQSNV